MEIEVGEWIRTEDGKIDKIIAIHNEEDCTIVVCKKKYWKEDISKHSKNIIDLVEVGDHVNGYKVDKISINTKTNEKTLLTLELDTLLDILFHSSIGYIKSIVTHEQFASIEYKVERDK